MDHHRDLLFPVGVDVEGTEALRQVKIDLNGAALPVAADGVAQHILELWPVKSAFTRVDGGLHRAARAARDLAQHIPHRRLGAVPKRVGANTLLWSGRE